MSTKPGEQPDVSPCISNLFCKFAFCNYRYVPADECVVDVSEEEESRVKSNLKNMDSGLAPYPYDEWKRWISLSNRISSATIGELGNLLAKHYFASASFAYA